MSESKEETDWLGKKYTVHRDDDGNKVGESREETDWLGKKYTVHRDDDGNKVGESREETDWLGKPYTKHTGHAPYVASQRSGSTADNDSDPPSTYDSDSGYSSSGSSGSDSRVSVGFIGFQKFAGVAGIVALIGWVVVWGVKEIAIALENGGETRSSLIKTVPGSMQITVGTKGFTEIGWPDGYDWEHAFYGANGEGYKRPVTIIAVKNGVRKVFGPNDDPCLPGLPDGSETTLIKAVAPADIEGNPTFVLTVVTRKVPSERR